MSTMVLMKNQFHKKKIAVTYPDNPQIIIQQCSKESNNKGQLISECFNEKSVLSKIRTKKFLKFLP